MSRNTARKPREQKLRDLTQARLVLFEESAYLRSLMSQLVKTFQPTDFDVHADEDSVIARLAYAPTDCALLDWRPEDGVGPKVLEFIRRNTACQSPEMGIVCLASAPSRQSVELARDLGANVYLSKPFSATELRQKIEAAIFAPRNFVVAEGYVGPDRRHRKASFDGQDRRGAGPLTQNEIDSMMAD